LRNRNEDVLAIWRVFFLLFFILLLINGLKPSPELNEEGIKMSQIHKKRHFRIAKENDVRFIRLQFNDILGTLKNVAITLSHLRRL
jgi:hypothetical protein